jgi:hypothetical protein
MPVKFGFSQVIVDRETKKKVVKHEYMKQKTTKELIDYINEGQKPKLKRKCRVELDRRGVKLVWKKKELDI